MLSFGLNKVELSEEQKENLSKLHSDAFKTFVFSEQQKTILQSLAPLTQEDKYSPNSLQLLRSLQLKPSSLSFLVSEEIIPNPHTDFGETKSPYLPLKTKFLEGEQKTLLTQLKEQQKQANQQEVINKKLATLNNLLD